MRFPKQYLALLLSGLILSACQTVPTNVPATAPVANPGVVSPEPLTTTGSPLLDQLAQLRVSQPRITLRDAAAQLNTNEAQLLAEHLGQGVTRLREEPGAARHLMEQALDLGDLLVISRNDTAVIEVVGTPKKVASPPATDVSEGDPVRERAARQRNFAGGYFGAPIDLRLDFDHWRYLFAVESPGSNGQRRHSLQFFDEFGNVVTKLFLNATPDNKVAYDRQVATFNTIVVGLRNPVQSKLLNVKALPPKPAERADSSIDRIEFNQAWNELTDVHQFSQLLSEFKVSFDQAMRLAPSGKTLRLSPQALSTLLAGAANQQVPFIVHVANPGITQIYSGTIKKTERVGPWYNVLDPDFNLHIREDRIHHGWMSHRGNATTVEFLDDEGNVVISFFALRPAGQAAPEPWNQLLGTLQRY